MWTAEAICVNDCNIKLEGTEAYFLPLLTVNITFSSVRHQWLSRINSLILSLSVSTTGTCATCFIYYIELHLASVIWLFNLVVSRSLICLTFTNGTSPHSKLPLISSRNTFSPAIGTAINL